MGDVIATSSFLLQVSKIMGIPVFVTQQYPKAFGVTVSELDLSTVPAENIVDKTIFSMMTPELDAAIAKNAPNLKTVILVGIEAHVCVLQTCYDLVKRGITVYLVCDGVSSQKVYDRSVGLQHAASIGVRLTTAESIVFQLMGHSRYEHFKAISALVKDRKETNFPPSTL